ncbi:hypothetical protein AK830_g419 [Neonectria ditissima]|uniref:beta-glucosidase n=1 Tax=Neonectria ditissima TaxID=78410 RepID=A0A0P7BGS2_9HYPO|nr:hypothetical protein AK830_g419 [Neonectria ditissima]
MMVQVDEQTLREIYRLPFQLMMRDSDQWCFMTSYNRVNGEYCAQSKRLIQDILREEWDSRACREARKVSSDQYPMNFIADLAAEGFVLLKDDNHVLLLSPKESLAIIGRHATNPSIGSGGSDEVLAQHIVSPLQGLEDRGLKLRYSPGVPVYATVPRQCWRGPDYKQRIVNPEYKIKEAWPDFPSENYCTRMQFSLTQRSAGNHTFSVITTDSARVYVDDVEVFYRPQEPELQPDSFYFFKAKIERRFNVSLNQGKTVRIDFHSWETDQDVLAWVPGTMFQGSSLRFTEYVDVPKATEDAAETAAAADVALVFVGNTNEIELEGYDRETMDLTEDQYALIQAVAARGPKTVVANFSGSPVTVAHSLFVFLRCCKLGFLSRMWR